jgi:drug/metabolite transporter (DMT)-like permease
VVFYKERLNRLEIFGALMLFFGLILFFWSRLAYLFLSLSQLTTGVLIILFAANARAAYALMQKPLLKVLSAKHLTLLI